MRSISIILGAILIAIPVFCQTLEDKRPSFEIATIKPPDPGQREMGRIGIQPGGRLVMRGVSVRLMLLYAYRVPDFQISGGPGWIDSDMWNIDARAEENSITAPIRPQDPDKPDPMGIRLQSLLEDRFQLKMHRETKDEPVYELTIAKSGVKMKLSEDQTPFQLPERGATPPPPPQRGAFPRNSMRSGRGNVMASAVPIETFIQALSQQVGRKVIDKTGLKGLYDITLQWTPESLPAAGTGRIEVGGPAIDPNGPSIFTALQEQLGLKLDSAKGPVDVIVIDSIQKPSEN